MKCDDSSFVSDGIWKFCALRHTKDWEGQSFIRLSRQAGREQVPEWAQSGEMGEARSGGLAVGALEETLDGGAEILR